MDNTAGLVLDRQGQDHIGQQTALDRLLPGFDAVGTIRHLHGVEGHELLGRTERAVELVLEDREDLLVHAGAIESGLEDLLFADSVHIHGITVAAGRGLAGVIRDRPCVGCIVTGILDNGGQFSGHQAETVRAHFQALQLGAVGTDGEDSAAPHVGKGVEDRFHAALERGSSHAGPFTGGVRGQDLAAGCLLHHVREEGPGLVNDVTVYIRHYFYLLLYSWVQYLGQDLFAGELVLLPRLLLGVYVNAGHA